MALTQTVAPAREPVTLAEAKSQLRITHVLEDAYITGVLIPAVRDRAQLNTQRQLIEATFRLDLDDWPGEDWIVIPRAPLRSVTSVQYVDASGVTQAMATSDYIVDAPAGDRAARGRVVLAYGKSWPNIRAQANAVRITFVAGYGTSPASVPGLLRKAMLTDLASAYAQREDVVVGTIATELPRASAGVYRSFKSRARQTKVA